MDCRTFHQKLEDYLQDGLNFSGRFGMERHAQQCISCGKELADAQQLRRMVSELQRVKAPANFESALLKEIAAHKTHGRFWGIRKYWIYGFELPSWRKMAYASTAVAALALGIFYAFHQPNVDQVSNRPIVVREPAGVSLQIKDVKPQLKPDADGISSKKPLKTERANLTKKPQSKSLSAEQDVPQARNAPDTDYVEYLLTGPDNYTVPVRLPKRIPMRYSQMSEEYFIQNVSH